MVFHMLQKKVFTLLSLLIIIIHIDFEDEFNFLGIIIHKHLTWNSPYKYDYIQNILNNWHIEQIKTPFSAQHTRNDI